LYRRPARNRPGNATGNQLPSRSIGASGLRPAVNSIIRTGWVIAAAAGWLFVTAPIAAQQEFSLDESDTWVEEGRPDPGTPDSQLATARRMLAGGRNQRAEFLATKWIDRYPQHPMLAEAYLVRADALRARGEYYQSLFDYEYIARTFTGSETFVTALERELEIAQLFASGTRRKFLGLRLIKASDEAEELLIRIQERLPGSRLAEEAGMTLGDFYFTRRQMDLAAVMYALFLENYPRSAHVPRARKRLIYSYLAAFKGPEFDATGLTARKLLVTAKWYLRVNDPIAAELTIRGLVNQHPRTVAAADAMRLIPRVLKRLPARIVEEAPDYDMLRAAILKIAPPPPPRDAPESSP